MNSYPRMYFYKRIVMAKLYIDRHYGEHIDVENIASEACFSKFDFIRQFKKVYKKTPYNYLKSVRINHAMDLLKSDLAVQDVCFRVGYESLSSFSGLFKKETGMTPSQFQDSFTKRSQQILNKPLDYIPGCFSEKNGWKKSNFEENPNQSPD